MDYSVSIDHGGHPTRCDTYPWIFTVPAWEVPGRQPFRISRKPFVESP